MAKSETFNSDCLEAMRGMRDNAFDLAIVDPPYGLDVMRSGTRFKKHKNTNNWDLQTPSSKYFLELFRVSKKQIIFGGNYFTLPLTGGWIYWNKDRRKDVSFADGELAWTNFLPNLREVKIRFDGFIGADEIRIHPTQKPKELYRAILIRYAKTGDTILDTHLGSGSSRIAAYDLGFDFTGYELDCDYHAAQEKRFQAHLRQPKLFEIPKTEMKQEILF